MVTAIEEPKRLESQSLDELIGNLKVHEMIIKKDSEIVKAKVEKKSFALKAKKVSSDEECSNFSGCDRRRVCTWPVRECPKPPRDKNQKAFVGGSWSDSGEEDDEKVKDETCLVAHASSEKNKGVDLECAICHAFKIENEKLKDESARLNKFEKSTHCLNEMLSNKKPSGDKLGLGFNSFKASSSGTKEIKFVKAQKKASFDGGPLIMDGLINMGGPLNVQAAPIIIKGPPPETPKSEKSVSFQKSILGPRPKHIIVNKVKVPVATWTMKSINLSKPLSKPEKIEESLNMTFDETPPPFKTSPLVDDDLDEEEAIRETEKKNLENNGEDETLEIDEIVNIKES
ncbi:hypothetical protein Tco_0260374 [Tanacetum coccineum]